MNAKSKPMMLRLPNKLLPAFERLHCHYGGLSQGRILRFIMLDVLSKPFVQQVEVIDRQLRGGR